VGYHRFGDVDQSRQYLQRAFALAGEYGFNQYLFEAEEALLRLDVAPQIRQAPSDISLDLKEVAGAIRDMREAAGVA
jgi:hypothetical protein